MNKVLLKHEFFIVIIFGLTAFFIYSFNLSQQPWHEDEVLHNAAGIVYFGLLKNGDLSNPCWNGVGQCNLMYVSDWLWPIHYGQIPHLFIGLGRDLVGANNTNSYAWSCYDFPCWNQNNLPSMNDLTAGRLFSPPLGALTVVLMYLIGRLLFNRLAGIVFAASLMFSMLWLWNSRAAMMEVYFGFFMVLSILLLVLSFRNKEHFFNRYFILSAITYGICINSKFSAIGFFIFLVIMIMFRKSFNEKITLSFLTNKKELFLTVIVIASFSMMSLASLFITDPYYYPNPLHQVLEMIKGPPAGSWDLISTPSIHNDNLFRFLATFHTTFIPYSFNYHHSQYADEPQYRLSYTVPFTYSSIPVSSLFFVGFGYLCLRVYKRNIHFAEFLLLIWFVNSFTFTALTTRDFRVERYYLPLIFPVIMIAAYGLINFIKDLRGRFRYSFLGLYFLCHIATTLIFWKFIYFSPNVTWGNPLKEVNLQEALGHTPILALSVAFLVFYAIILFLRFRNDSQNNIKYKIGITVLFLVPVLLLGSSIAYGVLSNEVIIEKHFVKQVNLDNKKIFDAMADVKDYPTILPNRYMSVVVLNSSSNIIYTQETLHEKSLKLTLLVKHTLTPYSKHVIDVLSGDAKGTEIIFTYEGHGNLTTIKTDAKIYLHGILVPLGTTFQYDTIFGSLEKFNDEIIDSFVGFAQR